MFGEEPNKELLLDFLNQLLKEEQGQIVSLTYLKNDRLGHAEEDRKAVFDLYCKNQEGERFIVELQKTKQKFFKDHTIERVALNGIRQGASDAIIMRLTGLTSDQLAFLKEKAKNE